MVRQSEKLFFFKHWIKNPLQVGAIAPSSRYLARLIMKNIIMCDDYPIIEIGAGTGSFTRQLLKAGLPPERIISVELDPVLCAYLRKNIPDVQVIEGDASKLDTLLPPELIGKIKTIISGIPMMNLPFKIQKAIIDAGFRTLTPSGQFVQFTYMIHSPLSSKKLGLVQSRRGITFRNLPPATVWSYTKLETPTE